MEQERDHIADIPKTPSNPTEPRQVNHTEPRHVSVSMHDTSKKNTRRKREKEDDYLTGADDTAPIKKSVCTTQANENKKKSYSNMVSAQKECETDLHPDIVQTLDQYKKKIKALVCNAAAMKKKIEEHEQVAISNSTHLENTKTANSILHGKLDVKTTEWSKVTDDLVNAKMEISENTDKMQVYANDIVNFKEKIENLEQDLATKANVMAEMTVCSQKLMTTKNQLLASELRLAHEKEHVGILTLRLTTNKQELDSQATMISTTTNARNELFKELTAAKVELVEYCKVTSMFNRCERDLQYMTKTADDNYQQFTKTKERSADEITTLKKKIEELKTESKTDTANLKDDIVNLKADIDVFDKDEKANLLEVKQTKQELHDMKDHKEAMQLQLKNSEEDLKTMQSKFSKTVCELKETEDALLWMQQNEATSKALFEKSASKDLDDMASDIKKLMDEFMILITCGESINGARICKKSNVALIPTQNIMYTTCKTEYCHAFFQRDDVNEEMFNGFLSAQKIKCFTCKSPVYAMAKSTVYNAELQLILDKLRDIVPFMDKKEAWASRNEWNNQLEAKKKSIAITPLRLMAKSIATMMIKLRGNEADTLYSVLEEELSHLEYDEKELVCDDIDMDGDVMESQCLVVARRDTGHIDTVHVEEFKPKITEHGDTQQPEIIEDDDTQMLSGNEDETLANEDETLVDEDETLNTTKNNLHTTEDDLCVKDDDLRVKDDDLRVKDDDLRVKDDDLPVKDDDLRAKDDELRAKESDPHTKENDIQMSQAESVAESVCLYVESQGY